MLKKTLIFKGLYYGLAPRGEDSRGKASQEPKRETSAVLPPEGRIRALRAFLYPPLDLRGTLALLKEGFSPWAEKSRQSGILSKGRNRGERVAQKKQRVAPPVQMV